MAKRNSKPVRIDLALDEALKEIKEKNEISFIQASREVANILKKMKLNKEKFRREIRF